VRSVLAIPEILSPLRRTQTATKMDLKTHEITGKSSQKEEAWGVLFLLLELFEVHFSRFVRVLRRDSISGQRWYESYELIYAKFPNIRFIPPPLRLTKQAAPFPFFTPYSSEIQNSTFHISALVFVVTEKACFFFLTVKAWEYFLLSLKKAFSFLDMSRVD